MINHNFLQSLSVGDAVVYQRGGLRSDRLTMATVVRLTKTQVVVECGLHIPMKFRKSNGVLVGDSNPYRTERIIEATPENVDRARLQKAAAALAYESNAVVDRIAGHKRGLSMVQVADTRDAIAALMARLDEIEGRR